MSVVATFPIDDGAALSVAIDDDGRVALVLDQHQGDEPMVCRMSPATTRCFAATLTQAANIATNAKARGGIRHTDAKGGA